MSKQFDFSIPLDNKRSFLLLACMRRYDDLMLTKLINIDLLKYVIQVLAIYMLKEPENYVNSVDKHIGRLLSILNGTVFPYNEGDYTVDKFDSLKREYKRFIDNLERSKAEKEANDNGR